MNLKVGYELVSANKNSVFHNLFTGARILSGKLERQLIAYELQCKFRTLACSTWVFTRISAAGEESNAGCGN